MAVSSPTSSSNSSESLPLPSPNFASLSVAVMKRGVVEKFLENRVTLIFGRCLVIKEEESTIMAVSSPTSSSNSSESLPLPSPNFASLPVAAMKRGIVEKILKNRVTLIFGEPGWGNMVASILCTQPRRFAVVHVAKMVGKSRDSDLGGEIGYHIGHSKIHTQSSKILFKTTGLLLDEMLEKGLNALKYKVLGLLGVTSDLSAADTQIKPTVSEIRELLQIFVKTFRGKTLILEVQSSLTIGKLKTMIKEGISAKHQRLTFCGKHLRDHFTLADYHIQNQSTLFLMLSLKGGAEAEDPMNEPIPNPGPEPIPNPGLEPLPNPLPYIDPNRIHVYIDFVTAAIPDHVTSAGELLVLVKKALYDIGIFQPFTVQVIVASPSQSRLPTPPYDYLLQIPNGIADRILLHYVYGVELTSGQVSDNYIHARFDQLAEARERERFKLQ